MSEAADRDAAAAQRDAAADVRDRLAAQADAELDRLGAQGAAMRARAATQRAAAGRDRIAAAFDRNMAEQERHLAAEYLAMEGFDHLTGALRREVGLDAIQREMNRSSREGHSLVVAFVDVDGLKQTNDERGHAAGDQLLRDVAGQIHSALRSYDVIARYGGDEFVCALSGDLARARERFDQIGHKLRHATGGATITVGLAEMQPGESLDGLVIRADHDMLAQRDHIRQLASPRR
jgi:diguanylate cyclase (GGDEF)-like protein